ncbi:MAG TPA: alkaline phosphatase family protein [Thermoanaerobaculia bacterium]|nr:alkaline phosphatase family protein [Thermoanaerobaculia bacterium]
MPIRWAYLKRVLAGAIFGMYMAHLLYFLNPQVEITLLRLATVTIVYGLICGLLFGSILWGLRAARVRLFGRSLGGDKSFRTHGFGFVVFAAFASSFIYWMHLELVRIYLPVGAVRILSKATNAITVTAFILLALWVIERNANRRTSRAILIAGVIVVAISSVFLYQRRESYRTDRRNVVVANIGAVAGHRPVIVVAVRNLPYDWIVTLKGEGLLPFFEQLTERAYFTRLEPFPTTSPRSLWASLATGKLPYRHGVTGRFSYRTPLNRNDPFLLLPNGVGFRGWGLIPPVERIAAPLPSGNALPVWSLFQRLQLDAQLVAWPSVRTPAGNPAALGNVAQRFNGTGGARSAVLQALANDTAAAAQVRNRHALTVVALEGFEKAQRALHIFSNELPPRASMKGDALRAYAQQLDRLVASIAQAHPRHVIVICSPSAVVPPPLPTNIGAFALDRISRDDPGADDGFVLIVGPGTTRRENPAGAHVADVVPTVLFAAGLPVGRDMDGSILIEAFDDETLRASTLSAIQTYEAERVVVRRAGA